MEAKFDFIGSALKTKSQANSPRELQHKGMSLLKRI